MILPGVDEELIVAMLARYAKDYPVERLSFNYLDEFPAYDIQVVDHEPDPTWDLDESYLNPSQTKLLYIVYHPVPTENPDATETVEEFFGWFNVKRVLVEDLSTHHTVWVKWDDPLPARPLELLGWLNDDVILMDQFGSPSNGFLFAVDVTARRTLAQLHLSYD